MIDLNKSVRRQKEKMKNKFKNQQRKLQCLKQKLTDGNKDWNGWKENNMNPDTMKVMINPMMKFMMMK